MTATYFRSKDTKIQTRLSIEYLLKGNFSSKKVSLFRHEGWSYSVKIGYNFFLNLRNEVFVPY